MKSLLLNTACERSRVRQGLPPSGFLLLFTMLTGKLHTVAYVFNPCTWGGAVEVKILKFMVILSNRGRTVWLM